MKVFKQMGSFKAKSEGGDLHTIIEFQEYEIMLVGAGVVRETEGIKKWKLITGVPLKQIDSEMYRIIETNEVIRKV